MTLYELRKLTDGQVLRLYRDWSESTYCAGFTSPSPKTVGHFIEHLTRSPSECPIQWEYEAKMIAMFRSLLTSRADVEGDVS